MSIHAENQWIISPRQLQRVKDYLSLTNGEEKLSKDPYWQQHYIEIIEAFSSDPEKAASAFNHAFQSAQQAMNKHWNKRIIEVPYPEKKNPYQQFDTIEQADAHLDKVKQECNEVVNQIMDSLFYAQVDAYHQNQKTGQLH